MSLVLNGTTGIVSANIQDGTITGSDIAGTTIVGANIANGTITSTQLAQPFTLESAVPASGSSIFFNGIPSWAKKITLMLDSVSLAGTAFILVRLGTSSSVEATGYKSQLSITNVGSATANSTIGFICHYSEAAASSSGAMTISHMGNNLWVSSGTYAWLGGSNNSTIMSGGSKQLSGVLTRIQILSSTGLDTFDAGTFNIMYE
jgi:hypothetical protein